jgi:hypothetical protein
MRNLSILAAAMLAIAARAMAATTPVPVPDFVVVGTVAGYSTSPAQPLLLSPRVYESGVLALTNRTPGKDRSYKVLYRGETGTVRVYIDEVEHPRWLLHRVESHFRERAQQWWQRTPEDKKRVPRYIFEVQMIDGHRVFVGPDRYVWTSGDYRVVQVSRDGFQPRTGGYDKMGVLQEFLRVYLARLPSSVPSITFDKAHEQQFVREAFDRDFEDAALFLAQWKAAPKEQFGPGYVHIRGILGEIRDRRAHHYGGLSDREWDRQLTEQDEKGVLPEGVWMHYPFWQAQYDELKQWWQEHRDAPVPVKVPPWLPER